MKKIHTSVPESCFFHYITQFCSLYNLYPMLLDQSLCPKCNSVVFIVLYFKKYKKSSKEQKIWQILFYFNLKIVFSHGFRSFKHDSVVSFALNPAQPKICHFEKASKNWSQKLAFSIILQIYASYLILSWWFLIHSVAINAIVSFLSLRKFKISKKSS